MQDSADNVSREKTLRKITGWTRIIVSVSHDSGIAKPSDDLLEGGTRGGFPHGIDDVGAHLGGEGSRADEIARLVFADGCCNGSGLNGFG